MREGQLILPDQLFIQSMRFNRNRIYYLVEHPDYFTQFHFHKKKLIFHRASMQYYADYLRSKGLSVKIIPYSSFTPTVQPYLILLNDDIHILYCYEPANSRLKEELNKSFKSLGIPLIWIDSPQFLTPREWASPFFKERKSFSMGSFYREQRKRLNILIENGVPLGGKWTFDSENRKKLPAKVNIPKLWTPIFNSYVREAELYIKENFIQNPGTLEGFFYPVTHMDAECWLHDFIKNRLIYFGPYEDAIHSDHAFLFHSLLSPLLNSGLLTPNQVLNQILDFHADNPFPLNSVEGFIRQLIGWREYVKIIYDQIGMDQIQSNFWNHYRSLPPEMYNGHFGIPPIDQALNRVFNNAYLHHIERLMLIGNFLFLCEVNPKEVYRWFMDLFIDSYPWVMVPNIFGMSQYADGGKMMTKPYFSSSRYIRSMSNYNYGEWCDIWDGLFW